MEQEKGEASAEERRARLNAEVEALLAAGGQEERVAQLVEEMGRLLGCGDSGAAAAAAELRPVRWRGLVRGAGGQGGAG
jgi:hypothetical protein